jgi:hypothetical protein
VLAAGRAESFALGVRSDGFDLVRETSSACICLRFTWLEASEPPVLEGGGSPSVSYLTASASKDAVGLAVHEGASFLAE